MNVLDSGLTLRWVASGVARELNPIMAYCLTLGDIPFIGVKIAAGSLGVLLLWTERQSLTSQYAAVAVGMAYAFVGVIHGYFMAL